MTWDVLVEMAKIFGLPLTMAFVAIWAFYRGSVVARPSYDAMVKEKDRQIAYEQERSSDLWAIVRPSIRVGVGALNELEAGGKLRR